MYTVIYSFIWDYIDFYMEEERERKSRSYSTTHSLDAIQLNYPLPNIKKYYACAFNSTSFATQVADDDHRHLIPYTHSK